MQIDRIKKLILSVIVAAAVIITFLPPISASVSDSLSASVSDMSPETTMLVGPSADIPPEVNGNAYVLYDATSGTFLLGGNQDEALSPASITKVLTVLLALENLETDDTITITKEMFQDIPNDYVRLGLMENEVITVEQALYGCMLNSCNDTAMALALKMADSVDDFSRIMNEKAVEIGCTRTNFTNPYGLADPAHLTSAHDMALILAEALKHEEFSTIATTKYYAMDTTNLYKGNRGMPNGNKFLTTSQYRYEYFIGGKTGYTDLSHHTLVAGARKDGRTLVAVILGAPYSDCRYTDMRALFDYGFSEYAVIEPDVSDFAEAKNDILTGLTSDFNDMGSGAGITSSNIHVDGSVTVTAAGGVPDAVDYTADDPVSGQKINTSPGTQTLEYPLMCTTVNSFSKRVGTLTVVIETPQPPESDPEETEDGKPGVVFADILKIMASILIAAAVVAGMLIASAFIRRKIRRSRKKKRRHPPVH